MSIFEWYCSEAIKEHCRNSWMKTPSHIHSDWPLSQYAALWLDLLAQQLLFDRSQAVVIMLCLSFFLWHTPNISHIIIQCCIMCSCAGLLAGLQAMLWIWSWIMYLFRHGSFVLYRLYEKWWVRVHIHWNGREVSIVVSSKSSSSSSSGKSSSR